MKDLSYFMKRPYKIELIEDTEEGGYTAALPELPGCLTCGKTMDEALVNLKDAKKAWLSAALEDGYPIPEPASTETFSGQFKLRLPKSLHRDLTERAKEEGTSLNQYCVYLLSQRIRSHSISGNTD